MDWGSAGAPLFLGCACSSHRVCGRLRGGPAGMLQHEQARAQVATDGGEGS